MTTTPATEIQRRLSEAVIDMINEFRLQRAAGPLPDKALDHIIYRAAHSSVQVLAPYNRDERNALWPSVIRMLLASFIREIGITDTMHVAQSGDGLDKIDGSEERATERMDPPRALEDWLPTPANVNA